MAMTPTQRLLAATALGVADRAPVIPIGNFPFYRSAGAPIGRMAERPRQAAQIILDAQRDCGHDCVYGRIGQNYEIQAMGGSLRIEPDGYPSVVAPRLVRSAGDLAALDPAALRSNVALCAEAELIGMLADAVGGRVPVMAYCQGPMRLAGQLMGPEELMLAVADAPDLVAAVLDFAVEASLVKAAAALERGADLIFVSDPMASGDLISPGTYEQLVLPRAARLIGAIRGRGATVILHICGDSSRILRAMAATGADILSLDWKVDLAAARQAVGGRVCLMGNLDPVHLLLEADAAAVEAESRRCLGIFGGGGYVLSGGCALPPATPIENIRAMVRAAEQLGHGTPA
jgi:uroporphyrinogen decarboxylase